MAWRFASRVLASGRCADDDWVDSGARTSVLAAVTSSPARAVVADKRTKAIRKNLRIVASIDDGDSLSYPGMKLCDLGHPSLPPARFDHFALDVTHIAVSHRHHPAKVLDAASRCDR